MGVLHWIGRGAALGLMGLLAAACASKIESDVARFHRIDASVSPGTFAIVPKDDDREGSLEFAQYAALVRGELAKLGWTPVNAANASDYVVEVDYDISDGAQVIRSRPTAFYGYRGGFGSHVLHSHHFFPHGYGGFNDTYSYTVYTRELEVDIWRGDDDDDDDDREMVFEGRAQSVGRDNRLPEVMPYLVQSMFTNFPGESGVTKHVEIKLPDKKDVNY